MVRHRTRFYLPSESGGKPEHAPTYDPTYKLPGAGYVSTATDIARFGDALLHGKLLDQTGTNRLFAEEATADGKSTGYALGFRVDDYYLRRAGLDYWRYLQWEVVDDWKTLLERLPGAEPWLFTKKAETSYSAVQFHREDVLVFGCESTGLPEKLLDAFPTRRLRIPIRSQVRSLNLSNCVAIASYEALRQWERCDWDG